MPATRSIRHGSCVRRSAPSGPGLVTTQPRQTPEAAHLAEQERLLAELSDKLAFAEQEFADAGSAFARFRGQYLRRFAPLYAELDRIEAEIARRVAEAEGTPAAHSTAARAAARADESELLLESETGADVPREDETGAAPPVPELKRLYREAAKQAHPDLAIDEVERTRRHKVMAALNTAYDAGDVDAIQRILDAEAARPEAITGDDVGAKLMRAIRKLAQVRARFTELEELTNSLRSDPLFALFESDRAEWEAGRDPLAEDEAALRQQVASAHARLAALLMAAASAKGQAR